MRFAIDLDWSERMYSTEHMRQYSEMKSKVLETLNNDRLFSALSDYPEPTFWEVGPNEVTAYWNSADNVTTPNVKIQFSKKEHIPLVVPIRSYIDWDFMESKKIYPAHPWFDAVRDACASKGLWFEKKKDSDNDSNKSWFTRIISSVRIWLYMLKFRWIKQLPYSDIPENWK